MLNQTSQGDSNGVNMAGRRIDDHSFWAGKGSKASVLPEGVHTKQESSADSAGSVMKYEDTTEAIRSVQEAGEKQVKRHPMKPGYRY